MGCNCGKNRATASGTAAISGTYQVMTGGKKVYESTSRNAAEAVGVRFSSAQITTPSGSTLVYDGKRWNEA